ncbi:unnamed protein product [Allacma fusca]|uniref:Gamma-butyrobetaine dioxygenase n=1 Tax=Allacma fusca TaxID=39272 RepID=A0A8J2NUN1_9HEXA|nr:unnamed protein product [Allacma fusca]
MKSLRCILAYPKILPSRLFHGFYKNNHVRCFATSSSVQFPIQRVGIDANEEFIQVKYQNGETESFPWHFLQDNCTCPECFHTASQSRTKRMTTLDLSKSVKSASVTDNETAVKLTWSDGHEGTFSEEWLKARSFSKANQNFRRTGFRDEPELVRSNYPIRRLDFQEVLQDDAKLLCCLKDLCKIGVVILENARKEVGQLKELANKIGFIRTTHYGNEFTVQSIPDAVNLAYTSTALTVHTDLPYYVSPPGVQALHCIKQFYGEADKNLGGESHLVDGFIVAHHMKENYPELYETLCNTPVEFYDIGEDYTKFYKIHHSPTFVTSPSTGNLTRIVYSNQQLSSYLPIDLHKAKLLYRAMKCFTDLCYHENYLMRFKLCEGEVLIFDNWRFLHGRSEFDPSKGERHLEGCYFDWDEVISRVRVLEN